MSPKHLPALSATLLSMLLLGVGCPSDKNVAYINPAGDAYGQSALQPPDADSVRANALAFRDSQNQPVNTIDDTGNAQAAATEQPEVSEGEEPTSAQPNEPTPEPAPSMERPTKFPGVLPAGELQNKQVRLETNKGTIVFEVLGDEGPKAASNFMALARSGYYDGLTWHRVVPGFVIQGGDPDGTGMGGPGYKFEDDEVKLPYEAGVVAMANAGPDTNGSQFFIVLEDQPSLPPAYSVFGRVTEGMEVVRKIAKGDLMTKVTVESK